MTGYFDRMANRIRGSKIIILVFGLAMIGTMVGFAHLVEDITSSYNGLRMLERVYGIKPANYSIVYFTMSLMPSLAQGIFTINYGLEDPHNRKRWLLLLALLFWLVDFVSDVQDRSNNTFITTDGIHFGPTTYVAMGITTGWFTVGSEVMLGVALGMLATTFVDALDQMRVFWVGANAAISGQPGSGYPNRNYNQGRTIGADPGASQYGSNYSQEARRQEKRDSRDRSPV